MEGKKRNAFSGYTDDGKYCGRTTEEWNEFWRTAPKVEQPKRNPYRIANTRWYQRQYGNKQERQGSKK